MTTQRDIPAHVPAELVFDCPLNERKVYFENVFETKISPEHAKKPPIYWCPDVYPGGTGAWVPRRAEDLRALYADDDLFSKKGFSGFAAMIGEDWNLVPTELGGAQHAEVRRVLNDVWSPHKILALEGMVRTRAKALIAAFKDKGHCDFVADFAVPFPVSIFLDLFGLPQDQVEQFLVWERALLHAPDMQMRMQATREVKAYLLDAIQQRRDKPTDDLISQAITYEFEGKPWSNEMVYGYCFNLFVGGLDTVTANIGLHLYHLATHPEQQAELRADRTKLTMAVEELLRAYAGVTTFRTVTAETTFGGIRMMAGDKVAMSTTLSGRDPEAWDHPNELRFDRKPRHLTFGGSSHRCLGIHLARQELQIAIDEMLNNLPEFVVDPKEPVPFWLGSIIQVQKLPLVWKV